VCYKTPGVYQFEDVRETEAAVMQWQVTGTGAGVNREQKYHHTVW